MTLFIPEPITILVAVLSFVAGFLYRKYRDNEDIADAFDEGFEKGVDSAVQGIAKLNGESYVVDMRKGKDLDR